MIWEIKKLLNMAGHGRKYILLLLMRSPFDALMTVLQASFLQYAFTAIQEEDKRSLGITCVLFMFVNLLLFVYNGTVWSIYAAFAARREAFLRCVLYDKISRLSQSKIDNKPHGEWITRLNTDVQMTTNLLNGALNIPHAVVAIVNITISATILCHMNILIFVIAMVFVIPHILISRNVVAKPMTSLKRDAQEAVAQNTTQLEPFITMCDTILLYDAQRLIRGQFEESSLKMRRANMKIHKCSALGNTLIPLFGMSGFLTILIIGDAYISSGEMTFGEITAALQYRGGLLIGTMMMINSLISIKANMAGVLRVNETCEMK